MARAPHTRAPDARRDGRDDAPAEPAPSPAVAQVLWLQSASGNRAVANQLARAPAPTGLPDKAPSSAPSLPGQTKVVAGPPPTGVEEGPHPGADLSAGTDTVTLTFVIRDLHLKGRHPSSIDWLHEPGVEVEASRDDISKPALSAAISAMNAHIRGRGDDIAEVALGAKAGVEHDGTPTAGAELKAQIKISTTFSITVGTSLSATPGGEGEQDPGKIPITPHGAGVKLEWTPMSIGVQFKLDKEKEPDRPGVVDYSEDMEDGKADAWAAGQLSAAELGQFDALATVEKLHDAMRAAKGDEAHWTMHLGPMRESEIPAGITRTLTRAAQLLVQAKPSLERLRSVRVTMVRDDEAEKREKAVRYLVLPLGSVTVASTPVAAAAPPLRTWGAPD
jgi:hypothetical protein